MLYGNDALIYYCRGRYKGKLSDHINGRHFAYDIFNWIFMNEKFCISTQISLNFVLKGPINNKTALV